MLFRKCTIVALLASIGAGGCIGDWESKEPRIANVDEAKLIAADLPNIALVRRVIPEEASKRTVLFFDEEQEPTPTTSSFGSPSEAAKPDCVVDGIETVIPDVQVVPTAEFWASVAGLQDEVALSELFEPPLSTRWHDLDVEFLVAAYHKETEISESFGTFLLMTLYTSEIHEVAGQVTIDVPNKTTLSASRVFAERSGGYGHVTVYPIVLGKSTSGDPCDLIGEHAAKAISKRASSKSPRILVIAAGSNPYSAAQKTTQKQ